VVVPQLTPAEPATPAPLMRIGIGPLLAIVAALGLIGGMALVGVILAALSFLRG